MERPARSADVQQRRKVPFWMLTLVTEREPGRGRRVGGGGGVGGRRGAGREMREEGGREGEGKEEVDGILVLQLITYIQLAFICTTSLERRDRK